LQKRHVSSNKFSSGELSEEDWFDSKELVSKGGLPLMKSFPLFSSIFGLLILATFFFYVPWSIIFIGFETYIV